MIERKLARRILFLGAAITGALAVFVGNQTKFDSDLLSVLPKDLPEVRGIQLYRGLFLDRADFLIVLESEDQLRLSDAVGELNDYLVQTLPGLEGRIAWEAPWIAQPELIGELAAYAWVIGDPERFDRLTKRLSDPAATQAKIEDSLTDAAVDIDIKGMNLKSSDPLGILDIDLGGDRTLEKELEDLGGLNYSSEDAKIRLISVDAPPEPGDIPNLREWDEKLAKALADWKSPSTVGYFKTGRAAYMVELEIGMKWELLGSVSFTAAAVLLLFYAFYGRLRPLLSLAICLSLTFVTTFAIAALLYDRLGILSVGFAAILIGLVVDYGVVVYQELQATKTGIRETVKLLFAPVFWAAFTTGGVFLFLARSAIPGIAQLGILVAIGVVVGAVVMILVFTPLAAATRARRHGGEGGLAGIPPVRARIGGSLIILFSVITLAVMGTPEVVSDPETLRPTRNKAGETYKTLTERMDQNEIGRRRFIVSGSDEAEVAKVLRDAEAWTATPGNLPEGTRVILPTALWPNLERAAANRANAKKILAAAPATRVTLEEYFRKPVITLFDETISYLKEFSESPPGEIPAPDNAFSDSILGNLISREPGMLAALGTFHADDPKRITDPLMGKLRKDVPGVLSAGWEHLATPIRQLFAKDLGSVVIPIAVALAVLLLLVFRRPLPVALSFLTLIMSMAWLLAMMRVLGVNWNLFNLAAVPLLLGLGLDYSIHMNLAAARAAAGDIGADRRVARALLVCSLSSAAGFGSLAWSHHPGLSSLGIICGIGILLTMFSAVYIIPGISPPKPADQAN